jgi:hypothetical protein
MDYLKELTAIQDVSAHKNEATPSFSEKDVPYVHHHLQVE